MELLPLAAYLSQNAQGATAWSALPDAPVVPDRAPRTSRAPRARTALATGLHRLADGVAPRRVAGCAPVC
jgi:hypothetical protein